VLQLSDRAGKRLHAELMRSCFNLGIGFRLSVVSSKDGPTASLRLSHLKEGDIRLPIRTLLVFSDAASLKLAGGYVLHYEDLVGFSLIKRSPPALISPHPIVAGTVPGLVVSKKGAKS
jgi:hypothetical protein